MFFDLEISIGFYLLTYHSFRVACKIMIFFNLSSKRSHVPNVLHQCFKRSKYTLLSPQWSIKELNLVEDSSICKEGNIIDDKMIKGLCKLSLIDIRNDEHTKREIMKNVNVLLNSAVTMKVNLSSAFEYCVN